MGNVGAMARLDLALDLTLLHLLVSALCFGVNLHQAVGGIQSKDTGRDAKEYNNHHFPL
jgi:hypothetical protein